MPRSITFRWLGACAAGSRTACFKVNTAYLSLGSNMGDRAANIERGLELLEGRELHVVRRSALYETEPQELRAQPWFLNMVAAVETSFFPRQLLSCIAHVERELGRQRVVD